MQVEVFMPSTAVTIEMDDYLIEKAETYFREMGLNLSSGICLLVKERVARDEDDLDAPYTEEEERMFYSPENIAHVKEGIRQAEEGKVTTMSFDDFKNKWIHED